MPYVNIKLTPQGLTLDKKNRLIRAVTELLRDELGKTPQTTIIIIEEVQSDNWGINGKSVTQRQAQ